VENAPPFYDPLTAHILLFCRNDDLALSRLQLQKLFIENDFRGMVAESEEAGGGLADAEPALVKAPASAANASMVAGADL